LRRTARWPGLAREISGPRARSLPEAPHFRRYGFDTLLQEANADRIWRDRSAASGLYSPRVRHQTPVHAINRHHRRPTGGHLEVLDARPRTRMHTPRTRDLPRLTVEPPARVMPKRNSSPFRGRSARAPDARHAEEAEQTRQCQALAAMRPALQRDFTNLFASLSGCAGVKVSFSAATRPS